MKFNKLEIQNFLAIRSASARLDDRGLHLVQGVNEIDSSATSNGAGKSSVMDAISWCLFGQTARDVKGDAVVNLGVKKDCRVTLTMSNGATDYRITRYRKHATGKNSLMVEVLADPDVDLSKGTDAETQKVLEKILGCGYEVFVAAVYSGQEIMPDLPRMKDRELKSLIEEAAGLQRIERAYELARERNTSAKNALESARSKVDSAKTAVARHELTLADTAAAYDAWGHDRADRVEKSRNLRDEATRKREEASAHQEALAPGAAEAALRIKEIEGLLADHRRLTSLHQGADSAVRRAELALDVNALKRMAAEVTKQEARIVNAATEVKKPCTECGTVLETMSVEDFVAHVTKHLEEAKRKLEAGKVTAREQVEALQKLREARARALAAVPDVTELVAERATLSADKIKPYADANASTSRCLMDERAAKEQLTLRETETNPHSSALELARRQLKEGAEILAAQETLLASSTKVAEVAAAVVKVFGPAGVRAQILDNVTPFLNERTADYLSALSDGEIQATWTTLTKDSKGDLKEKFSIDVVHAKGGESFNAISGGEKRKVRLATALALQDLVASRATQPLDIWIGDEVDDALDPAGLERLMTILERKARERGTVLVISHSDLRDWVDNVTTVRKTGQWNSIVEGSLCV